MKWFLVAFMLINGQWQQHIADPAHCPKCTMTPVGPFDTPDKCEQAISKVGEGMGDEYSGPEGSIRRVGGGYELKLSHPGRSDNGLSAMRVLCVQMGEQ
jgi:hypothetical protein